jgi:hypothetical protein
MENLGIFYDHYGLFYGLWKYLWQFGIFLPILVFCTTKNLATLVETFQRMDQLQVHDKSASVADVYVPKL